MKAHFAPKEPVIDGIDFVLTPREKSDAAIHYCAIQKQRRLRNQLDQSREVSAALAITYDEEHGND